MSLFCAPPTLIGYIWVLLVFLCSKSLNCKSFFLPFKEGCALGQGHWQYQSSPKIRSSSQKVNQCTASFFKKSCYEKKGSAQLNSVFSAKVDVHSGTISLRAANKLADWHHMRITLREALCLVTELPICLRMYWTDLYNGLLRDLRLPSILIPLLVKHPNIKDSYTLSQSMGSRQGSCMSRAGPAVLQVSAATVNGSGRPGSRADQSA